MKLFLVTRRDLPLSEQATQFCHALRAYAECYPALERDWYKFSKTLVLHTVADRDELKKLVNRAVDKDIRHAAFHEPSRGSQLTAVAFGANAAALVRSLTLFG